MPEKLNFAKRSPPYQYQTAVLSEHCSHHISPFSSINYFHQLLLPLNFFFVTLLLYTLQLKAALIGALFLIDFMYGEKPKWPSNSNTKYKMLKTPHHMQYFWKAVQGYQIWHWQWQPESSKWMKISTVLHASLQFFLAYSVIVVAFCIESRLTTRCKHSSAWSKDI